MSDAPIAQTDKTNPHSEAQARLSADADVPKGSSLPTVPASNDAHVAAGTLPSVTIDGADSGNTHWGSGAMAVAGDLLTGAKNQITQNPGQVAESGVIGLGIGAAAGVVADGVVAVGAAVGVTLAAPEVLAGAAVLGAAYGAYELYQHADSWFNAAKVVSNKQDYSPTQVSQADAELQGVGAGGVNVAAGFGGAMAGSYIAGTLAAGAGGADAPAAAAPGLDTTPAATPPVDAPATPAPGGATPPVDAPQTPATPAAAPPSDAPATPAQGAATPPGDGPATPEKPGDAPSEPPKLTAQEQAVADSVKANQAIFNAADQDNGVISATKQAYNVKFEKVTEPTQIQTLEGLKTGTTETVKPGQWIATRLNPDGSPNIEKGIENQWAMTDKNILKTYQTTPDDLQNGNLVAATKTDAPPVNMVQLKAPLTIQTPWGTMSGEPGDWLANYDYANGQPGSDYAIVTNTSFGQTYQQAG